MCFLTWRDGGDYNEYVLDTRDSEFFIIGLGRRDNDFLGARDWGEAL